MIPQSAIEEWRNGVLWKTDEQYLIICHALTEIFKDEFLSDNLFFRGASQKKSNRVNLKYTYSISL